MWFMLLGRSRYNHIDLGHRGTYMWAWPFTKGAKGDTAILIQCSALSAWFSQWKQHVHGATGVRVHITERRRILRQQVLNLSSTNIIYGSFIYILHCYICMHVVSLIENNLVIWMSCGLCLSPWAGKSGWILKVLPHTVALLSRLWFFFCDQEGQFLTPAQRKYGHCIRSQFTKLIPADKNSLNQHESTFTLTISSSHRFFTQSRVR